jgi:hypothetical protein
VSKFQLSSFQGCKWATGGNGSKLTEFFCPAILFNALAQTLPVIKNFGFIFAPKAFRKKKITEFRYADFYPKLRVFNQKLEVFTPKSSF